MMRVDSVLSPTLSVYSGFTSSVGNTNVLYQIKVVCQGNAHDKPALVSSLNQKSNNKEEYLRDLSMF